MARSPAQSGSKIGLAAAGGGPAGFVYEIGAARALDEALDGFDFNALDVYVGVSAGAFLGACLANGLTTADLACALVSPLSQGSSIDARVFLTPAFAEFVRRWRRIPGLLVDGALDCVSHPLQLSLGSFLAERLSQALPVAVFDNEPIRRFLQTVFTKPGRTDDFRKLRRKLVVVAADLDSAEGIRFGESGHDHVPISRAVQASAALPGLYPPVLIDGRYYVDGVLLKTMHASVALESGADLVICINPLVPIDTTKCVEPGQVPVRHLEELGLPTVLQQTFRTMIHSRMFIGLAAYAPRFPGRDVVLFEPQSDDAWMFFTNIFSFASRKFVCEQAYLQTRRSLLSRYDELQPMFARHGISLRRDVLEDDARTVWSGLPPPTSGSAGEPVTRTLDGLLVRLDALLAGRALVSPPTSSPAAAAAPR